MFVLRCDNRGGSPTSACMSVCVSFSSEEGVKASAETEGD